MSRKPAPGPGKRRRPPSPRRDSHAAVRAHVNVKTTETIPAEAADFLARFHIPQNIDTPIAPGNHCVAIRTESKPDNAQTIWICLDGKQLLACAHFPDLRHSIHAARGKFRAIRAEGDRSESGEFMVD